MKRRSKQIEYDDDDVPVMSYEIPMMVNTTVRRLLEDCTSHSQCLDETRNQVEETRMHFADVRRLRKSTLSAFRRFTLQLTSFRFFFLVLAGQILRFSEYRPDYSCPALNHIGC